VPTLRFRIRAGEPKRIAIRVPFFSSERTVLFDGVEVGRVATLADLRAGATFALPDGSTLGVRTEKAAMWPHADRLRVEIDGVLLRESPAHPAYDVRQASYVLWFVGGLTTLVGGAMVAAGLADDPGAAIGVLGEGLLYLGLAWQASREKRWALIVGLVLYLLDSAMGLAGRQGASGIVFRIAMISLLARGIAAHRELAKVDAHAVAQVFR
jgi:hypothetical protein